MYYYYKKSEKSKEGKKMREGERYLDITFDFY